jgi:HlyD family secretion protein
MATSIKGKWLKRGLWTFVVVGLLGGGGLMLRARLRPDNSIDPSKLVTVERGDIARSVVATGKVEPRSKVEVKSKASGIVEKLLVDYGQFVQTGQVLAELDKEQLQAIVREARASLAAAQAAEQSANATFARNQVEAEAPDLPFLKSNVDRARELNKQSLIARSAVEDTERIFEVARNKQLVATRNVAVTQAEVARAMAQVAQAQAALERAQDDLNHSTITSPMDGLVLSRNVEVGVAVSSILVMGSQATLLFTLGDVAEVYVLGKVDQSDIGKVHLGQPARITVESYPGKVFTGEVIKISPLGVEKDNITTFEVRVSIRNPQGMLKAAMSANAEIVLEEKKGVVLVPESALIYAADRSAQLEIPDTVATLGKRKTPVKVGLSNGVKAEILSGIEPGTKVILQ